MSSTTVVEINLSKFYFQPLENKEYEIIHELLEQVRSLINQGSYIRFYKEIHEVSHLVRKDGRFQFESTIFQTPEKYFVKDLFGRFEFEEWEKNILEYLNNISK